MPGGGREGLDSEAKGPHEPSQGSAQKVVILDNRDQWRSRHAASRLLAPHPYGWFQQRRSGPFRTLHLGLLRGRRRRHVNLGLGLGENFHATMASILTAEPMPERLISVIL